METTYTDRYREELSEIFSSILKIDTKFCGNKKRARSDFEKGLISEDILKRVEEADYHTVLDGDASPYALVEEERKLVVRFTSLSEDGSLYLNDINEKFNDLVGRMDAVADTVKIYFKYYNMSLKEFREEVAIMMSEKFSEKKTSIEDRMQALKNELGSNASKNDKYKALEEQLKGLDEEEENVLNNVRKSSFDVLMEFIIRKYSLNEDYYRWFRVRKNKENQKNGIVPEDSTEVMLEEQNNIRRLNESTIIYKDLDDKLKDTQRMINEFAVESLAITTDIGRRLSLNPHYSKKECYELFQKFFELAIFFDYCASYCEESSVINSFEIFNKFYERKFVNAKSVDPNEFKFKLIEDVLQHYIRKAKIYSQLLAERKVDVENWYDRLSYSSDELAIMVRNTNDYAADINDNKAYLDGYLSIDMLDRLYISLNEYFDFISKKEKTSFTFKKDNEQ